MYIHVCYVYIYNMYVHHEWHIEEIERGISWLRSVNEYCIHIYVYICIPSMIYVCVCVCMHSFHDMCVCVCMHSFSSYVCVCMYGFYEYVYACIPFMIYVWMCMYVNLLQITQRRLHVLLYTYIQSSVNVLWIQTDTSLIYI